MIETPAAEPVGQPYRHGAEQRLDVATLVVRATGQPAHPGEENRIEGNPPCPGEAETLEQLPRRIVVPRLVADELRTFGMFEIELRGHGEPRDEPEQDDHRHAPLLALPVLQQPANPGAPG